MSVSFHYRAPSAAQAEEGPRMCNDLFIDFMRAIGVDVDPHCLVGGIPAEELLAGCRALARREDPGKETISYGNIHTGIRVFGGRRPQEFNRRAQLVAEFCERALQDGASEVGWQ